MQRDAVKAGMAMIERGDAPSKDWAELGTIDYRYVPAVIEPYEQGSLSLSLLHSH